MDIFSGDLCCLFFVFQKKKHKSTQSPVSKTVNAPPNEWIADIEKKEAVMRKDESEDDNLATFTLSSGRGVEFE